LQSSGERPADETGAGFPHRFVGHRGAAAQAPENTIAGFRRAASLGLTCVEFDVRITADGHPVIVHDKRLDRTTDGSGAVAEISLQAIRALDAGAWFGPEFVGERVPTLEQGLDTLAELDVAPSLEIKAEKYEGRQVAEAVLACLAKSTADVKRNLLVSSYNEEVLTVFRESAPEFPRALVVRRIRRGWRKLAGNLGCREIHGNHHYLTRTAIHEMTDAGLSVCAFTVDDAALARRLLGWGVARIISNVPDSLLSPA
jgi:glycerophosphoryl diester phosphodiesterase